MAANVAFTTVDKERDADNPTYTTVHQDAPLGDDIFRQYQALEVDNFPWRYDTMMTHARDGNGL